VKFYEQIIGECEQIFFANVISEIFAAMCIVCMLKVQFSGDVSMVTVLNQLEWAEAYQEARCGLWEQYARDRDRFARRIQEVDRQIGWVLSAEHRAARFQYLQTCKVSLDDYVCSLFPS